MYGTTQYDEISPASRMMSSATSSNTTPQNSQDCMEKSMNTVDAAQSTIVRLRMSPLLAFTEFCEQIADQLQWQH